MAKVIFLSITLLSIAPCAGCGARTELQEQASAIAAQGGSATQGGSAAQGGGGAQGGSAAQGGGGAAQGGGGAAQGGGIGHTGGAGGSAGSDVCPPLIDDMENGTGRIQPCKNRIGNWYAYNDGFGSEFPAVTPVGVPILPSLIVGGRGTGTRAMFASYTPLNPSGPFNPILNWGAGIGVDLNFDGQRYGLYDASAYDGISFWMRGSGGGSVQVRVSTAETTLVAYGGTCPAEFCAPLQFPVAMSADWEQRFVAFKDLIAPTARPPSRGIPFRKDRLTNIQFLFASRDSAIEFWLDDLSFFVGAPPTP